MTKCNDLLTCPFGHIHCFVSLNDQMFCGSEVVSVLPSSYMFWTDWGREPCIERADMDGNNRRILIRSNLGWPNGIAIDEATSRIIWVDAKTEVKHFDQHLSLV